MTEPARAHGAAYAEPFVLMRYHDETGVSGTGLIADGVRFPDGTAVIHWRGDLVSTTVFESVEVLEKIHGHNGKTQVVFIDPITAYAHMAAAVRDASRRLGDAFTALSHAGASPGAARP